MPRILELQSRLTSLAPAGLSGPDADAADTLSQTAQDETTATFTASGGTSISSKMLQRSLDNVSFSDVAAQVRSPFTATLIANSLNYFRLRETKDDSSTAYSNVVTVSSKAFGLYNGNPSSGFNGLLPTANPTQQGTGTTEMFGRFDAPTNYMLNAGETLYLGIDPDGADVIKKGAQLQVWWYLECASPTQKDTTLKKNPITGQATLGLVSLHASDFPQDGMATIYAKCTTTQGYETIKSFTVFCNANNKWPAHYVYVDAVNGNDAKGIVNSKSNQFQHIMAAATAAQKAYNTLSNTHILLANNQTHDENGGAADQIGNTINGPPLFIEPAGGSEARATTKLTGNNASNRWSSGSGHSSIDKIWSRNLTFVGDPHRPDATSTDVDCDYVGSRTDDPDNSARRGAAGWKCRNNAFIYGCTRRAQSGPLFKGPTGCDLVNVDIFQITDDGVENCHAIVNVTLTDDNNLPWVNYWKGRGASVSTTTLHTDHFGSFNQSEVMARGFTMSMCDSTGQNLYIVTDNGSLRNFSFKNCLLKAGGGSSQFRNNRVGGRTITNIALSFCVIDGTLRGDIDGVLSTTAISNCIIGDTGRDNISSIKFYNTLLAANSGRWSTGGVTGLALVAGGMSSLVSSPGTTGDYSPKSGGGAANAATSPDGLTDVNGHMRQSGTNKTAIGALASPGG
jgi:hypothetical protein